ncbi:MFS transporter, DHA1 family, tetracycline resistance protein [Variovorax sp. OK605]|uniref:Tet(A)/Tet(B)/Tet(C) family tetracycline efflux MFS transporter n=1 Tax=unclassified Variovorax TaxID=663243 RepID=UPI0008BCA373|nr:MULTISPECIES: Tet(A)/Tet(B)/Tet(C) family tetracycline efflux MFS transporter [unclassified Variovorax]SEJ87969.1 MFS transporter, DHA1 family, tetracycline resistance protein [Variovorax sp. OK202]SFD04115.1 MFS transporter, DHA1 family, tetracycline resistance protein [Variovorax sp. OK212]SFP14829.1 MFS transporter, DHA1 family, tetracycline resistance protein [Variovorax sp. OK605]
MINFNDSPPAPASSSRHAHAVILAIVTLDAVGISLVMPIVPGLLREVGHTGDLGWRFGAFLSLYALMQFLCAPVLGALSDRFGRRPVLLVSVAGAAIDALFMAFAPSLWMLFVGRAVAGMTGASMAVASAAIADLTPEHQRARWFGRMGACFGLGFIAGPAIGGVLGDHGVRLPFVAAAVLNGLTFLAGLLLLRESRPPALVAQPFDRGVLHPLAPLRWAAGFPALLPMLGVFGVLVLVGEVAGTTWVIYGEDKFAWNGTMVGLSLACFGLFHALMQAFVAGPVAERWGERATIAIGTAADFTAYALIAFATRGWMALALLPVLCLGGVAAPALRSSLSSRVGEDHQGRLQGVLASITSLAAVLGPLLISPLYFAYRATFPGIVWLAGAAVYVLCLPVLLAKIAPRGP